MRKLRVLYTFYRSFTAIGFLITLSCLSIVYLNGINTFVYVFWLKIITSGIIILFINSYKRKEFYYYSNLGFSKSKLWLITLGFDIFVFMVLLIIIQYYS